MNDKPHKDPQIIAHAQAILQGLSEYCASLNFATILTEDGFEVASLGHDGESRNRMAAMASSMQALGEAVTRDLKKGGCEYIIVAAPQGYMIQLRVPGQLLVMAACFDAGETLGKALSVSKLAAAQMAAPLLPMAV